MDITDLYFKHFPESSAADLHFFMADWGLGIRLPHYIDSVRELEEKKMAERRVLAEDWIFKNSKILNKKEEMERQAMNIKFKWVTPDEPSDAILFTELVLGDKNASTRFSGNDTIYDIEKFIKQFEKRATPTLEEGCQTEKYSNEDLTKENLTGGVLEGFKGVDYEKLMEQPLGFINKPLEFIEKPDMYELVSESYYMLQELTEKKRQEEDISPEKLAAERKAAIDAMTPKGMIDQVNTINSAIDNLKRQRPDFPIELISDGYHTFKELYEFRMLYNAALFNEWAKIPLYNEFKPELSLKQMFEDKTFVPQYNVHKSWKHHDGELCFGGGWFIVSAMLPTGLIINHYKAEYWDCFKVPETEKALFKFDRHTSNDVLNRLSAFLVNK